ncbi:MAG TPA: transporter substrate-binding domain-containing protein [Albidovulum sp.]|uniref:substrate-binding periplasmic protein n=1 Tax=Albidovulum sp. TaxID=1872424 RepID=UPI002B9EF95C|nr:transporter substrate-binding domain-containing protein [Albidovulum sp.]
MTIGRREAARLLLAGAFAGLSAPRALARCEGIAPGQKPQNTFPQDVGQTLDDIVARGFIEIAVYEDYRPYSWEDGGKPMGIDVEIGRIIAESLGVEARFRFVEAGENLDADLLNYIWKGATVGGHVSNLMMRVPYNSDYTCRVEQVVFTGQYASETIAIAYRLADYPEGGPKPAYFRYDTVAVENDSISDFYLTSLVGPAKDNIHRYGSTAEAMEALAAGEVMAAMGPLAVLEAGLTPDLAVHRPPLPNFSLGTWTVGIALHMSHRDLGYAADDAISAALGDGRIPAIYAALGLGYIAPER